MCFDLDLIPDTDTTKPRQTRKGEKKKEEGGFDKMSQLLRA